MKCFLVWKFVFEYGMVGGVSVGWGSGVYVSSFPKLGKYHVVVCLTDKLYAVGIVYVCVCLSVCASACV